MSDNQYKKGLFLITIILLTALNAVTPRNSLATGATALSTFEKHAIDEYVDNLHLDKNMNNLESAVGQMFLVGIPGDYKNYYQHTILNNLISKEGIGGIFLSNYHVYSSDDTEDIVQYAKQIQNFLNYMQDISKTSTLNLPLLMAVDFEGPRFSSLKTKLMQAPPALTLSATSDPELLQDAGRLVGCQLRELGIHAILGPVIDVDSSQQGEYNYIIQNRSFGGDIETVYNTASNYIVGLKSGGLTVFGKHFPGHGTVIENPHNEVTPEYSGNMEALNREITTLSPLSLWLDGVVTSHIALPCMHTDKSLATFNGYFIKKILRDPSKLNLENAVIVTDDLSDMGVIRLYMNKNKIDFGQIAIRAFNANHDLLLFAHVEIKRQAPRGHYEEKYNNGFSIEDLLNAKRQLFEHIKGAPIRIEQLSRSLKRILYLKVKIAKNYGATIEKLVNNDVNYKPQLKYVYYSKPLEWCTSSMTPEKIVSHVMDSATTLINRNADYNLLTASNFKNLNRVTCYVPEKHLNLFRNNLETLFVETKFVGIPASIGKKFSSFAKEISVNISLSDLLIYAIRDIDDVNMVSRARSSNVDAFEKKVIILIHNNPTILPPDWLNTVTIFGSFCDHELAYKADIKVLLEKITPGDICHLRLNLGRAGNFHNYKNVCSFLLGPPKGLEIIPFEDNRQLETVKRMLVRYQRDLLAKNDELRTLKGSHNDFIGIAKREKAICNELVNVMNSLKYKMLFGKIILFPVLIVLIVIITIKCKFEFSDALQKNESLTYWAVLWIIVKKAFTDKTLFKNVLLALIVTATIVVLVTHDEVEEVKTWIPDVVFWGK